MTTATLDPADIRAFANEAIDEGIHAAQRAVKTIRRGVDELSDLRDEATHRIRRQPLKSVAIAFGAGALVGTVAGVGACIALRPHRR